MIVQHRRHSSLIAMDVATTATEENSHLLSTSPQGDCTNLKPSPVANSHYAPGGGKDHSHHPLEVATRGTKARAPSFYLERKGALGVPSPIGASSSPLLPLSAGGGEQCYQNSKQCLKVLEEGGTNKRSHPRLVAKNGECLVNPINQPTNRYYYRNWFHIIIEQSWRHIFVIFTFGFVASWLFFGSLYYLIVYASGDLEDPPSLEEHYCIANVRSFISAFLFSLESQHTIGYGSRYMTEMCPPAFLVLCIQLVIGVLLQTMLAGIVIAKVVLRPKKRKQEMRFSETAVIGPMNCVGGDGREGPLALMIRVADVQHRLYLAESHVRLYMASTRVNKHGRKELVGLVDMNVGYDTGTDRVLLLWPVLVRHVIDEGSPLYGATPSTMSSMEFELIMTIEGIVEATGMTFQEIMWGRRFVPIVAMNDVSGQYEVDYELFDKTECSFLGDSALTSFTPLEPELVMEVADFGSRAENEEEEATEEEEGAAARKHQQFYRSQNHIEQNGTREADEAEFPIEQERRSVARLLDYSRKEISLPVLRHCISTSGFT